MTSYLLEWWGVNGLGANMLIRSIIIAPSEEAARRKLISDVVEWGGTVKKIELLGKAPVQPQ